LEGHLEEIIKCLSDGRGIFWLKRITGDV